MKELCFGHHMCRPEPPDIFLMMPNGDVDEADVRWFFDEFERFAMEQEFVFMLIDASRMGSISAEARRAAAHSAPEERNALANNPDRSWSKAVAVFGASFTLRVISGLIMGGFSAFFPKQAARSPLMFFATEYEARAWLADRRKALSSTLTDEVD